MAQVLVRKLEDEILDKLKTRAKSRGRSMEAEIREILREATSSPQRTNFKKLKRVQKLFEGLHLPDSTQLIREDRDR